MANKPTNYLQNSSFMMTIPKFPNVQFYGQSISIPQISLNSASVGTPFVNIPLAGDKPEFSPLTVNFIIDEKMNNYYEVFNWIKSIGFAESNTDYTNYANKNVYQQLGEQDVSVFVMDGRNNLARTIVFYDAIPIGLSTIELTSQDTSTNYTYGSATFAYTYYDFV